MTLLQIVNQVLVKLREEQVAAFTDSEVATIVAELTKDVIMEIQNTHDWSMLKQTVDVSAVADDYDYSLTGVGREFRVINVWNATDEMYMERMEWDELYKRLNYSELSKESPYYYGFNGLDGSYDPVVHFWPVPNGSYTVKFNLIVPQKRDALVAATEILIPAMPVIYAAWERSVYERGEDNGAGLTWIRSQAHSYLADAIAYDKNLGYSDLEFFVE